jgi:hypothetical protein
VSVNDSFVIDIMSDLSSPLQQQQFNIEISVATMAEGGLDRYLGMNILKTLLQPPVIDADVYCSFRFDCSRD